MRLDVILPRPGGLSRCLVLPLWSSPWRPTKELIELNPYLAANESDIDFLAADEAEDQVVDGLSDIMVWIGRYEECLKTVIAEGFRSKLNVLMANACKHRGLRVDFLIFTCFSDDAAFNVAEESTRVYIRKNRYTTFTMLGPMPRSRILFRVFGFSMLREVVSFLPPLSCVATYSISLFDNYILNETITSCRGFSLY